MSESMQAVATAVMALRDNPSDVSTQQALYDLIVAATPEYVEATGNNIFNTGPALLAIENCQSYAGALVVHYELDKLRRQMGLEKPVVMTRGPGGGR